MDDSPEATLVRITGNGSLQDYEFRRSGDREFVLELNDIKPGGTLSLLPISSDLLTLNGGEIASPKGLQLVGALRKPLDYYAMDTVENQLILTLYLVKGTPVPKRKPASTRSVRFQRLRAGTHSRNLPERKRSVLRGANMKPCLLANQNDEGSQSARGFTTAQRASAWLQNAE